MTMRLTKLASIFVFLLCGLNALPAQAYLDPGSGSLIIQSIIGALAAFGITMKLYWHKIKLMISGHKSSEPEAEAQENRSIEE